MNWEVRLVTEPLEREAVYRLRYDVYVREMNRKAEWADHVRGLLSDPLDQSARVLALYADSRLVGTVRSNGITEAAVSEYRTLYGVDDALDLRQFNTSVVVTKLVVHQAFRRRSAGDRLICGMYDDLLRCEQRFTFIDTNPHLMSLYLRYGFRPYRSAVEHPEYGNVQPLLLNLHDISFLEEIKSPFCPVYHSVRGAAGYAPSVRDGRPHSLKRCPT